MGCLVAAFALIWKIFKAAFKIAWKVLRFLLFKCGLIFIGVYLLGTFLLELGYGIGLSFTGALSGWYIAGFTLALLCTATFAVLRATKKDRQEQRDRKSKEAEKYGRGDDYRR